MRTKEEHENTEGLYETIKKVRLMLDTARQMCSFTMSHSDLIELNNLINTSYEELAKLS